MSTVQRALLLTAASCADVGVHMAEAALGMEQQAVMAEAEVLLVSNMQGKP